MFTSVGVMLSPPNGSLPISYHTTSSARIRLSITCTTATVTNDVTKTPITPDSPLVNDAVVQTEGVSWHAAHRLLHRGITEVVDKGCAKDLQANQMKHVHAVIGYPRWGCARCALKPRC